VQAAVDIIAELRRSLREDPPDVFVERIRTLWLAEVTAAVRYLGGFRRARIERFLADLETALVAGEGGDAELARFLRVAVEQGQESRVPSPPDLETDAVHVMTIHRAKGLDFEHVYVAQIHKGGRGGGARNAAAMRRIGGRPEYRLFGWITPGFAMAEWVQTKKTRAEMVRLLYVAATRAKKRLVISGGWRQPGVEIPPESATDFSRLIGHRLDPESVARQIDGEAEREEDEFPQVMRVMPVFTVRFESAATDTAGDSEWSIPEGRLERAVELAAARRAAAERMEQPVFRSASAEAHDRLRRAEAEGADSVGEGASDQGLAMALGTAVHEMLEVLDLDRELAPQVAEHRAGIVSEIGSGRDGEEVGRRADELLTRIAEGECLSRLASVAPNVLSRELPVMLWSEEEGAPGAVVSGIVDLVYRDPEDGRLVVADYKTDRIEDAEALAERTRVYEPQVGIYARALQEALDLDHRPHTELWFLDADRIVRL
jgi:ATP-dependent helicase/nuclease subunit A